MFHPARARMDRQSARADRPRSMGWPPRGDEIDPREEHVIPLVVAERFRGRSAQGKGRSLGGAPEARAVLAQRFDCAAWSR